MSDENWVMKKNKPNKALVFSNHLLQQPNLL